MKGGKTNKTAPDAHLHCLRTECSQSQKWQWERLCACKWSLKLQPRKKMPSVRETCLMVMLMLMGAISDSNHIAHWRRQQLLSLLRRRLKRATNVLDDWDDTERTLFCPFFRILSAPINLLDALSWTICKFNYCNLICQKANFKVKTVSKRK